LIHNA